MMENVILRDSFLVGNRRASNQVECIVTLSGKGIAVERKIQQTDGLGENSKMQQMKTSDIVGCRLLTEDRRDSTTIKQPTACGRSTFSDDPAAYLTIYAYPLRNKILARSMKRQRCTLSLKILKSDSKEDNLEIGRKWRTSTLWLIRGVTNIPPSPPTPRRVLVFVNPCSGPGKALQIFRDQVVPLFSESGLQYDLVITDRANCARDYVKTKDLTLWDGIVIVSGDGLLYEVFNGLMERTDWENSIETPIGIIPGGSGNGLAMAISYALGEQFVGNVIMSATLNTVRGRVAPMDLVRVHTLNGFLYSFLSIGWGIMADIDIESERFRAIGGARFALWGIVRAIGLRKYRGKVSYVPIKGHVTSKSKVHKKPNVNRSQTVGFDTSGHSYSVANASRQFLQPTGRSVSLSNGDGIDGRSYTPLENGDNKLNGASIPKEKTFDDINASIKEETIICGTLPPLDEPVPDGWVVIEDEFVLVYVSHQTHLSTDVLFAPDAKLDDGIMWLVVIRAGVTRAQVMQFLLSLEDGSHVRIPYVDVIPVQAFRLEPFTQQGYLTIDGEVIECTPIQAEVMPSVARVMTR